MTGREITVHGLGHVISVPAALRSSTIEYLLAFIHNWLVVRAMQSSEPNPRSYRTEQLVILPYAPPFTYRRPSHILADERYVDACLDREGRLTVFQRELIRFDIEDSEAETSDDESSSTAATEEEESSEEGGDDMATSDASSECDVDDETLIRTCSVASSKEVLGKECSICLDSEDTKKLMCKINKCSHIFHARCFIQWMRKKGKRTTCPLCRGEGFSE